MPQLEQCHIETMRPIDITDSAEVGNVVSFLGSNFASPPSPYSLSRACEESPCFVVYNDDKDIIGTALTKQKEGKRLLTYVATAHECRRSGIGDELMDRVEESAPHLYCHVREPNDGAIDFYKKRGYNVTGIIPNFYFNGDSAVTMEKAGGF